MRTHQAGVGFVLHIADQNPVFDQYSAASFVAFVVDIERTASVGNISLVNDSNAFGGHTLADSAGENAGFFAVEIAFQTMSNRFVQQHARPAVAQNDGHLAGRRRTGLKIGQGLFDGGIDKPTNQVFIEIRQIITPAAARAALLATLALLGNDGNVHAHHRADVGSVFTVQTGDVHHVVFAGQTGHHLHDTRIGGFGQRFNFVQQRDFGGRTEAGNRVNRHMDMLAVGRCRHFDAGFATGRTNHAHCFSRAVDRINTQAVGVGKSGFITRYGTHAHALIDLEAARFDDAFFQMPTFMGSALTIDVGIIDMVGADNAQALGEQIGGKMVGFEQISLYRGVGLLHNFSDGPTSRQS